MDYMTAKEAAKKWEVTPRRVQVLCAQGKVPGAVRFGVTWAIPKDAVKPSEAQFNLTIWHDYKYVERRNYLY